MSQELIDHSPDLKRLIDEGYSLEIRCGYALVHDVPYVNSQSQCCIGTLVCPLTLAGNTTARPENHVIHFMGEQPCNADGSEITSIKHSLTPQDLGNGIVVQRSFSNKPKEFQTFANYYDKFINYIRIICAPVHVIAPTATPQVFKPFQASEDSVFNYRDTNSSRANIGAIVDRLKGLKIGIVGLGGTGSYILDLVAKTPVEEIHLFDGDKFYSHNAFRAPGAVSKDELELVPFKAEYFASIYAKMHRGVVSHNTFLGECGLDCLSSMNFVFLSVDSGADKKFIVESLCEAGLPFVDTGIGINIQSEMLCGAARLTAVTADTNATWKKRMSYVDTRDDVYASNIQIAEINSLCAAMAVIKWKKLFGVYSEQDRSDFSTFDIGMGETVNEN